MRDQRAASSYTSTDTTMFEAINIHQALEAKRGEADKDLAKRGPRLMVVGPADSGKSTLVKILSAYAARAGQSPLVIDLDVGQTSLTVPGMLAVGEVAQGGIDAAYGINASKANVFALPFGHANPGSNPRRYDQCVSLLADVAKKRIADNDGNRRGGILVNTCGWVDGEGLELLKTSIRTLSIDVVIVMGDDRLHSTLVRARDVGSAFDKSTTISRSREAAAFPSAPQRVDVQRDLPL